MSLFQAREKWSVRNGCGEEFDLGCLCIGNVDNDPSGSEKIITGSYSGVLRVYLPRQNDFKIEDLLAEEELPYPICQIKVGLFVANSDRPSIAILHPRVLAIYTLEAIGGSGASASYFKLHKNFEHRLGIDGEHFTAYNMVTGPFGNSQGRDHICVQSLDGRLQFFEQDSYAFTQQFNTCLVPGPLCYASQIDAIVTANSEMQVECYKYQVLATAVCSSKKDEEEQQRASRGKGGLNTKKQLYTDWKTNLGEPIIDIRVGRFSRSLTASQFDIVVLGKSTAAFATTISVNDRQGECSLFCLGAQGGIRLQKRLGYHPSAFCLYARPSAPKDEETHSIIIGSHTGQWMVYQDTQLLWSACTENVPVELAVTQVDNTPGMIIALDQEGLLSANYLGTDPISTVVGANDTKEIDYEELDEEHRKLLGVIRQSQGDRRVEPRERVLLRIQVPDVLDPSIEEPERFTGQMGNNYAKNEEGKLVQLTIRIFVTYTGKESLRNVTLSIDTPNGIVPSAASVLVPSVVGGSSTPLIVPITLHSAAALTPTSLDLSVSAAYTLESGQPRTSICTCTLPMIMVCKLVPPVKSSSFKFTLDTNQQPPQLSELFDDMLSQPGSNPDWAKQVTGSAANVLSFRYHNGIDVTILVSKNAGRYRIQSNELEALWLVSNEFVHRLEEYFKKNDSETLKITYQEPLPLADFFLAIDQHFEARKRQSMLSEVLNQRSHQLRIIQKRLLVRFKDRNPAPLNQLDTLFHETYSQLLNLSTQMEETQAEIKLAANRLSCSVSLILLLMSHRFELNNEAFGILRAHLSPTVDDNLEQGWEEITDAAMTHLLRTTLAKTAKSSSAAPVDLTIPDDTTKLKKHITIVCDRLAKGGTLTPTPKAKATTE